MADTSPTASIFDRLEAEGVPSMQPNPEGHARAIERLRQQAAKRQAQLCTCPCCTRRTDAGELP